MWKLTVILVMVGSLTAGYSQVPAPQPKFEAATVKPNNSDDNSWGIEMSNGSLLRVRNATLKAMIEAAYDVRDFQVSGGPNWIDGDRFDVMAKPEKQATDAEMRQMMQALLAERFHLKLHHEQREGPLYELRVARGGPKLTPGAPGANGGWNSNSAGSRTQVKATSVDMQLLVQSLGEALQRPVVDKTGLTGTYDFQLTYSSDIAPSIFTALQEQLGLRLDSVKGPMDVIVIDSADKPAGIVLLL